MKIALPQYHWTLARQCLGLPQMGRTSIRNRAVVVPGQEALRRDWQTMVERGAAERLPPEAGEDHDVYRLTRAGAEAALLRGEKLCPLEFPTQRHAAA